VPWCVHYGKCLLCDAILIAAMYDDDVNDNDDDNDDGDGGGQVVVMLVTEMKNGQKLNIFVSLSLCLSACLYVCLSSSDDCAEIDESPRRQRWLAFAAKHVTRPLTRDHQISRHISLASCRQREYAIGDVAPRDAGDIHIGVVYTGYSCFHFLECGLTVAFAFYRVYDELYRHFVAIIIFL